MWLPHRYNHSIAVNINLRWFIGRLIRNKKNLFQRLLDKSDEFIEFFIANGKVIDARFLNHITTDWDVLVSVGVSHFRRLIFTLSIFLLLLLHLRRFIVPYSPLQHSKLDRNYITRIIETNKYVILAYKWQCESQTNK